VNRPASRDHVVAVCGEASNESVTGQGKTSLGFSVYSTQGLPAPYQRAQRTRLALLYPSIPPITRHLTGPQRIFRARSAIIDPSFFRRRRCTSTVVRGAPFITDSSVPTAARFWPVPILRCRFSSSAPLPSYSSWRHPSLHFKKVGKFW
jgi:hypothetical protein